MCLYLYGFACNAQHEAHVSERWLAAAVAMRKVGLICRDHAGTVQHRNVTVGRGLQPDATQS
jgi:hypothetical protein